MSTHLRKKGDIYHARLKIPVDVRESFPGKNGRPKREFSRSLETGRKPEAVQRAALIVSYWLNEIQEARGKSIGSPESLSASAWARTVLEELKLPYTFPYNDDPRLDGASTDLENQVAEGHIDPSESRKALKVATGTEVLFQEHAEAFLSNYEGKSRSSLRGTLKHFLGTFKTPEDITPESIRDWWQGLAGQLAAKTLGVVLSTSRSFMRYLKDNNLVKSPGLALLKAEELKIPRTATKSQPYKPWTVDQCKALLVRAAGNKTRPENLILMMKLGMYTGARIEEVCSIRREDVHLEDDWLTIRGTKTAASKIREVPIHPELKKALKVALVSHKEEWLIPQLEMSKHGDRANAIGKQFGRLKTEAGFTSRVNCFHSFRKTLVTQMEQAGVNEGVVADIVGHDKDTITYGVYSGGSSMAQKKSAIQILSY